jgi:nitrate reductase gamma subunit
MLGFALRKMFARDCLMAKRVFARSKVRGFFLLLVTWGFILLMITLIIAFVDYYLQLFLLRGEFYRLFSLIADIAGFLMLIGLVFAIIRRYLWQPREVVTRGTDSFMLLAFLITVLSGFFVEGSRLAITGLISVEAAPFGLIFTRAIEFFVTGENLIIFHRVNWIIHVSGALVLLGSFPYSKLFHIITAPITTAVAQQRERRLGRGR